MVYRSRSWRQVHARKQQPTSTINHCGTEVSRGLKNEKYGIVNLPHLGRTGHRTGISAHDLSIYLSMYYRSSSSPPAVV